MQRVDTDIDLGVEWLPATSYTLALIHNAKVYHSWQGLSCCLCRDATKTDKVPQLPTTNLYLVGGWQGTEVCKCGINVTTPANSSIIKKEHKEVPEAKGTTAADVENKVQILFLSLPLLLTHRHTHLYRCVSVCVCQQYLIALLSCPSCSSSLVCADSCILDTDNDQMLPHQYHHNFSALVIFFLRIHVKVSLITYETLHNKAPDFISQLYAVKKGFGG